MYGWALGLFAVFLFCQALSDRDSGYNEFTCPKRCNELYNPICGQNGDGESNVFVNECYMSMENCNKTENEGEKE